MSLLFPVISTLFSLFAGCMWLLSCSLWWKPWRLRTMQFMIRQGQDQTACMIESPVYRCITTLLIPVSVWYLGMKTYEQWQIFLQ
ncbi:MAG: hypothetical protein JWM56_1093 [Candidatus Peribacteria bacterium]|nr:hypothetical protein [Candidatus Peribacteria bacterium]